MSRKRMPPPPPNEDTRQLVRRWGGEIEPDLLGLALTHRSYAFEAGGTPHNERLEFLGDSVLSVIVSDRLFRDHPDLPESDLSRMRAATVSQEPLAMVARSLGLGDFIRLGKGESLSGGRDKDSILSDTVEALIGATYLSSGIERTREVVLARLSELLGAAVERGASQDHKTALAEYLSARGMPEPVYVVSGEGPDHQRTFHARVCLGDAEGPVVGEATQSSKKHAENGAAGAALVHLRETGGTGA